MGADHDILPGVALVALAKYSQAIHGAHLLPEKEMRPWLDWYRRRFCLLHRWLMIGWQMQAWSALHALTDADEHAAFVFEMADWALDWQLEKNGAFLTDLHVDGPSFHTACVAEGIGDAWALAQKVGDRERASRYGQSWRAAIDFMDTLMIGDEDTYCMPDPQRARGGVRLSATSTALRIDFASHLLLALLKGVRNMPA